MLLRELLPPAGRAGKFVDAARRARGGVRGNSEFLSSAFGARISGVPSGAPRRLAGNPSAQGLKLTAPLTNKFANVHLLCPAFQCGNSESMVRWVRRPGGGYDYDFSILERYLDVYADALGRPDTLMIDVSAPVHSSQRPKDGSVLVGVSVLDRAERRARNMLVPYGHEDWRSDEAALFELCARVRSAGAGG